jgi:predicted lactoylglutathione lyase
MTSPAHPGRMLFVNIPVADLERSKAFFAKLGFSYHPGFTDETAACMLVGEHAFVMLLSREKFAEFAKLPIADPTTHTLALYCFSVGSRDEVDAVSAAALAAGGSEADDAEDYGFMYSRSFFDLDGHVDGPGSGGAGPGGVRGLDAGRRRPGLTRHHVRHVRRRRAVRAAACNLRTRRRAIIRRRPSPLGCLMVGRYERLTGGVGVGCLRSGRAQQRMGGPQAQGHSRS